MVFSRHRSNPDKVAVSFDVSNAFNTVHRAAVLRAVRVHFPSLSPWVDCCYCHESTLFTGSGNVALQSIRSARGIQQGDPLGPVLFALPIHPAIAEARAAPEASHPGGLDVCSFFLDDGFCAGSSAAVRCFPSALTEGFRRIGLTYVGQDGGHPGVFARPVSSALMTSRGAHGTVLPISSFWVLLLGLMRPPVTGPRMHIVAPCPEDCRQ